MNSAQLLIVCPRDFIQECSRYANFKRSCGVSCHVVPFDPDTLPKLSDNLMNTLKIDTSQLSEAAARLKLAILSYYFGYQTRYVLLVGDADRLPVPWFEFVQSGNRYFYPTDLYYADLFKTRPGEKAFDSWDPDKDGVKGEFRSGQISAIDFNPDISVGRIPASSAGDAAVAFDRLMARRARPPRFLILHGNDPQQDAWLAQAAADAVALLRGRGHQVSELSIPTNASATDAGNILTNLRTMLTSGLEYIVWFGHGSTAGWHNFGPHLIQFSQEVPTITSAPVVFSVSCEVGAYTRGVYGNTYFSGGSLTSAVQLGSSQVPLVPDAIQPTPSTLEADFAPEEWLVRHAGGASALIAGHSWGSLGSDYLKVQPIDFLRTICMHRPEAPPPFIGAVYNTMLRSYLSRFKSSLGTDEAALNHLLRIHLFGDPTAPLFC